MDPLSPPKRAIADVIKRNGKASVDELSLGTGLGATTIRQHLDDLQAMGLVSREAERGGRGRPRHLYKLSDEAAAIYPSQDPEVLRGLLRYLQDTGRGEVINSFFEQFWEEREKQFEAMREASGAETLDERIRLLKKMLVAEGFMPDVVKEPDGSVTLRECNCPFRETVRDSFVPCQMEAKFIERALEQSLARVEYIPQGSSACTYSVAVED